MLTTLLRMMTFVLVSYLVYLGLALLLVVAFGLSLNMVGLILLAAVGGCAGYFSQREVAHRINLHKQSGEDQ